LEKIAKEKAEKEEARRKEEEAKKKKEEEEMEMARLFKEAEDEREKKNQMIIE